MKEVLFIFPLWKENETVKKILSQNELILLPNLKFEVFQNTERKTNKHRMPTWKAAATLLQSDDTKKKTLDTQATKRWCKQTKKGDTKLKTRETHGVSEVSVTLATERIELQLDSGASSHVMFDRSLFDDVRPSSANVSVANGQSVKLEGQGSITLDFETIEKKTIQLTLTDCLLVPSLTRNLVSVGQLMQHTGFKVDLKNEILELPDKQHINVAKRENLFFIEGYTSKQSCSSVGQSSREQLQKLRKLMSKISQLPDISPAKKEHIDTSIELAEGLLDHPELSETELGLVAQAHRRALQEKLDLEKNNNIVHQTFGHPGQEKARLLKKAFNIDAQNRTCMECKLVKSASTPFVQTFPERRAKEPLERVHADITPILTESNAGHKYLSGFRDQYSGFVQVYPIVSRSEVMNTYLRFKRDHGQPRTLRTDGEYIKQELEEILKADNTRHEFTCAYTSAQNADMESLWRVILQNTRMNINQADLPHEWWHLAAKHAAMQLNCWPRKSPISVSEEDERTKRAEYLVPFTAFKGHKPRIELLHPFGCTAIVHKRKEERGDPKLSRRATLGIYMGVSNKRKAFKVYLTEENRFVKTRNVRFIDNDYSQSHKLAKETEEVYNKYYKRTEEPTSEEGSNSTSESETSGGEETDTDEETELDEEKNVPPAVESSQALRPTIGSKQKNRRTPQDDEIQKDFTQNEQKTEDETDFGQNASFLPENNPEHPQHMSLSSDFDGTTATTPLSETLEEEEWRTTGNPLHSSPNNVSSSKSLPEKAKTDNQRYPKRNRSKPKQFWKAQVYSTEHQRESQDKMEKEKKACQQNPKEKNLPEPRTFKQAMCGPKVERWKEAITEELENLKKNETYKIVPKPETKTHLVKTKWVFKRKIAGDGTIERYKARLVAKGYTQKWCIDYFETFAPVAGRSTIRTYFARAAAQGTKVIHIDIKGAFLISDLKESIFITIPEGFELSESFGSNDCLQLLKSLYGLKQAGRNWFLLLTSCLSKEMEFDQSKIDQCLFTNKKKKCYILMIKCSRHRKVSTL